MPSMKNLDSSLISLIILSIVYIKVHNRSKRIFLSNKLFIALVRMNITMLVIDLGKWLFNGLPGSINMIINKGIIFLHFSLAPVALLIWILYTNYLVRQDKQHVLKLAYILLIPFIINVLASAVSLFTGWIFLVDDNNIYHRGKYIWVFVVFCFLLLGISFYSIFKNRRKIEKISYYSLISFSLPAIIGITLQLIIFGSNYAWLGMMLSLLIVYFYLQDRNLKIDYLTGVFNRRQLDRYIKLKIQNCKDKNSFSAILIDLDKFKKINDSFGHDIGDEALQESVNVIKKCLRKDDFIARFGGDEFYIILDISDRERLEDVVNRIRTSVERFNQENIKPYKLGFSIGYDIYDYRSKMKPIEFLRHLDKLMYYNKNSANNSCELGKTMIY